MKAEDALETLGDNKITLFYDCGCKYFMRNKTPKENNENIDDGLVVYELCRFHTEEYTDQVKYR